MSRHGATKDRILRLISRGTNNLSAISVKLELAESTVSKHLHQLERAGSIRQKDSAGMKKWKYYEVNQADSASLLNFTNSSSTMTLQTMTSGTYNDLSYTYEAYKNATTNLQVIAGYKHANSVLLVLYSNSNFVANETQMLGTIANDTP